MEELASVITYGGLPEESAVPVGDPIPDELINELISIRSH